MQLKKNILAIRNFQFKLAIVAQTTGVHSKIDVSSL